MNKSSVLNYDMHAKSEPANLVYIPTNFNNPEVGFNNRQHIPPPTPGPRTIEDIQNDARDRFAGIVWIQKDPSFSLEDYFLEYDNYNPYSETKSYSKRKYQAAYTGIMRDYNDYLCILNGEQGEEFYVVAKRIRSELEVLEPYCTCSTCSASSFNPVKYIWCPHCTKCIKAGSGFANPILIEKARKLKRENEQQKKVPSKYRKHIEGIHWVKTFELTAIGCVVLAGLYYFF